MIVKQYVTGEGFPYLGRSHRLLLVDDQDVHVRLEQGRFKMRRADAPDGRRHIVQWYTDHARLWLEERVSRFARHVGVAPGELRVKDLGYRWGSCGRRGRLYFHWRSILLPARIVEYVVVHELVHLHEPHHTPEFWRCVERTMPDFAARKQRLAENGQEAAAI
jgi:predicted metal-dependent hydrolase